MIKGENFNIPGNPQGPMGKPCILVAPLDWGLGHATRCIPVISSLIQQNCTVIVAAEGQVKLLLQKEFPGLEYIELRGYRVKYSRYKFWMPVKLLLQLPKIMFRIYAENQWLKKAVEKNKINAVISDNRMGLFHKKIPCVYITHQLTIKTGSRFTENIAQKIHYHFINKFSACWVPDAKGELNLAGTLSHPAALPKVPVNYLGILSRFKKQDVECKYDLCIVLSGPEPQRTIFEKTILEDLKKEEGRIFFIRGLPGETEMSELKNLSIEIKNHLTADELCNIIQQSKIVISRCGYSTVMDLVKLQKKAILVPTPGQTEQEYLAEYLQKQRLFYCVDQGKFSLPEAIEKATQFEFAALPLQDDRYKNVVEKFIASLKIDSADT
ncbi:MAG: glycosyl transferase family 28 [Ferruginibacter sp.]|nr:glycosyl transferase family 28 [Ferruginibacter sp.]